MPKMKYTLKDSVFTFIFKQLAYARELYLALHPKDPDVTEADCKLVTPENILTAGMYNDIGLQVEIMVTLFDQEKVMEIHDYHVAEAARRDGLQEGRAEGRAEGVA